MNIASSLRSRFARALWSFSVSLMWSLLPGNAAVSIEKLPEPGLQPQTIAAPDGTVHLLYLAGDPKSADVLYRKQRAGSTDWAAPLRVNSQPGSAIAIGTIRGAQFALGRAGRVHVAWNGSGAARPKPPHGGSPILYARLNDDGTGFSEQRNLMSNTHELDGGGSVAADKNGRVFVVWHASAAGSRGETNRAIFIASSSDDGATFSSERPASPRGTGACGCCGLASLAVEGGKTFILFRTARTMVQRDMALLVSSDRGERFAETFSHPWSVATCPMSSMSLTGSAQGTWAAWESAGRVHFARFSGDGTRSSVRTIGPPKGAKHPRLAVNARGEMLIVWAEGTGWQRGGVLAWQVFDASGEPTADKGRRDGLPAWNFATTYARPDGSFVILY
jgi:hypothetical protein